jgi:hypothetical protein
MLFTDRIKSQEGQANLPKEESAKIMVTHLRGKTPNYYNALSTISIPN